MSVEDVFWWDWSIGGFLLDGGWCTIRIDTPDIDIVDWIGALRFWEGRHFDLGGGIWCG